MEKSEMYEFAKRHFKVNDNVEFLIDSPAGTKALLDAFVAGMERMQWIHQVQKNSYSWEAPDEVFANDETPVGSWTWQRKLLTPQQEAQIKSDVEKSIQDQEEQQKRESRLTEEQWQQVYDRVIWITLPEKGVLPIDGPKDFLVRYETGEIRRIQEHGQPWELITHIAQFPIMPE